jgi:hypothetical protein
MMENTLKPRLTCLFLTSRDNLVNIESRPACNNVLHNYYMIVSKWKDGFIIQYNCLLFCHGVGKYIFSYIVFLHYKEIYFQKLIIYPVY